MELCDGFREECATLARYCTIAIQEANDWQDRFHSVCPHWYDGAWHTEYEWQAHLAEREAPRFIWPIGDEFTDGTTTGTLEEVLDA